MNRSCNYYRIFIFQRGINGETNHYLPSELLQLNRYPKGRVQYCAKFSVHLKIPECLENLMLPGGHDPLAARILPPGLSWPIFIYTYCPRASFHSQKCFWLDDKLCSSLTSDTQLLYCACVYTDMCHEWLRILPISCLLSVGNSDSTVLSSQDVGGLFL